MFGADYRHSGETGTRKKDQKSGKTAKSIRIYRDLLTFCLTNSLREYLMNYEYINALLISYKYIMVR